MYNINDRDFNTRLDSGQVTSDSFVGWTGDLNDEQRQLLSRNDAIQAASPARWSSPDTTVNSETHLYSGPAVQLPPEDPALHAEKRLKSALNAKLAKFDLLSICAFFMLSFVSFAVSSRNTSAANDFVGMMFGSFCLAVVLYFTVGRLLRIVYRRRLQKED